MEGADQEYNGQLQQPESHSDKHELTPMSMKALTTLPSLLLSDESYEEQEAGYALDFMDNSDDASIIDQAPLSPINPANLHYCDQEDAFGFLSTNNKNSSHFDSSALQNQ